MLFSVLLLVFREMHEVFEQERIHSDCNFWDGILYQRERSVLLDSEVRYIILIDLIHFCQYFSDLPCALKKCCPHCSHNLRVRWSHVRRKGIHNDSHNRDGLLCH